MKLILIFIITYLTLLAEKPKLFLLKKYTDDMNVSGWYMSEKLDGVRAYWDGEKLISRNGKIFKVPHFFIKDFPKYELDGELWSKRGEFSNISSIVNKQKPHIKWNTLTYNIFEVPNAQGNLLQRLSYVKQTQYIRLIKQIKVKNKHHLDAYLKEIEAKGGEGVVVRDGSLLYYARRNKNSLKVKSFMDAECKVVAYNQGKGKYENKVGSIRCKLKSAKIINIGSGLSDALRENPPKVGTIVTFKYYGLTSKGNPRFPIFLRERK